MLIDLLVTVINSGLKFGRDVVILLAAIRIQAAKVVILNFIHVVSA
jgi:hypothetical protein